MAAELLTGLSIFKSMLDTARGLKDINDTAIRNTAAIDLQEKILAAQAQQTELVERVSDLEKELAAFNTWEAEKRRYQFEEIKPGILAYKVKETMRDGEPSHYICAGCYGEGKKSVLQSETWFPGRCHVLVCHRCGSALYLDGHPHLDHPNQRPKRR